MSTKRTVYVNGPPYYGHTVYIQRRYGFFNFLFDIFMMCITGGLWLIWIFVREMRKR